MSTENKESPWGVARSPSLRMYFQLSLVLSATGIHFFYYTIKYITILLLCVEKALELDPVCTTQEDVENRGLALKLHPMFSVHIYPPEEFKTATITSYFGFLLEYWIREIT